MGWICSRTAFRFTDSTIRDKPFPNESSDARRCWRLQERRRSWLRLKPATQHTNGAKESPRLGTMSASAAMRYALYEEPEERRCPSPTQCKDLQCEMRKSDLWIGTSF